MRLNKSFFLYGTLMGLLLLLLQAVKYKIMIREMEIEIFALIISIVFISIGIWLGMVINKKKNLKSFIPGSSANILLSKREIDVLMLIAEGNSNQEIADQLFVSLNTIKTHIANIFIKLNVKRRTQAIQKAQELKIISIKEKQDQVKSPKSMT
ncbi:MAG: NarL family two-component system response regulator LiaR [Cyclobacteriaceae bacterium]|jgi:NarL family two-component system response regulator LiaR